MSGSSRRSHATISWRRSSHPCSSRVPALSVTTRTVGVVIAGTVAGGHGDADAAEL